jgi:hypothetical protein
LHTGHRARCALRATTAGSPVARKGAGLCAGRRGVRGRDNAVHRHRAGDQRPAATQAVAVMLEKKARPRGCVEGKVGWGRRERAGRAHLDGVRQTICTATAALRAAVRRGEERDRGEAAVGENYAGIVARKLGDGRFLRR